MKKKIPLENKDIKDWEEYINNPHNVFDKDIINKKIKNIKKYKIDLKKHKYRFFYYL